VQNTTRERTLMTGRAPTIDHLNIEALSALPETGRS
jgi:hypothetical protein